MDFDQQMHRAYSVWVLNTDETALDSCSSFHCHSDSLLHLCPPDSARGKFASDVLVEAQLIQLKPTSTKWDIFVASRLAKLSANCCKSAFSRRVCIPCLAAILWLSLAFRFCRMLVYLWCQFCPVHPLIGKIKMATLTASIASKTVMCRILRFAYFDTASRLVLSTEYFRKPPCSLYNR